MSVLALTTDSDSVADRVIAELALRGVPVARLDQIDIPLRRLGLVYGAADLICDEAGNWVFLETNQSGEWGWLTAETGVPIATALADLLAGEA